MSIPPKYTIYQEYPVTKEEQLAIQRFILQKVTHQVTLDIITMIGWVLKQHHGDGKLGLG